jgi:mono/diheme cytochrome c family protein
MLSAMKKARRVGSVAAVCAVLVVGGVGLTACGGDDEAATTTTEGTTTEGGSTPVGREVFVANCGSCHTLSDAGTTGSVGPELDGGGYSVDQVETQVRNGGGGMPAFEDTLSDEDIAEVAAYVAAASGG